MENILIAATEALAISAVRDSLESDYNISVVHDRESCLNKFREKRHEFMFIDISLLGVALDENISDFQHAFEQFKSAFPTSHIIVLSSKQETRKAVDAVKAGADDYLTYPIDPAEVRLVIESAKEIMRSRYELEYLRDQFWKKGSQSIIHTLNPVMKKVFDKVKSVATTKTTVLLTGETGTGKGVVARLIHLHSHRYDNQFISVHCGAMPETLIESELFGHEKGAFTGAVKRKLGKFEIAKRGTIFLDEVGTITQPVQIKLLQVLQEKTFSRVGGETEIETDVRIIAASNEDLAKMIEQGSFRKDLYYRLNVFPIEIPPLRERIEDIPFLVQGFLEDLNKRYTRNIRSVHQQVMEAFRKYDWPGNIREMENLVERAYIIEESNVLSPEGFPDELFEAGSGRNHVHFDISRTLAQVREDIIESAEKKYLEEKLAEHKGRIDATAKAAGIGTRQLHKLLTKYGIQKSDYKESEKNKKK